MHKFFHKLQAMSEDNDCHVFVRGFPCDGEFLPVKEHKYKIEFVGDSITSGEGTYGAISDTDWLTMYMSSSENYATFTAKALDADYRIISQGGWGVYCGWDNDVRHNIPSYYEKSVAWVLVRQTNPPVHRRTIILPPGNQILL